jgi:hypothetical protein
MRKSVIGFLIIATALLSIGGCSSSDNSNPPVTGTLSGRVIFHGQWPDSGTVQLSIFTNWNADGSGCSFCGEAPGGPPAYYTPAAFFQDPNPNNGDGPDTVNYTITGITLGDYAAVAVGWRAPHIGTINCDEPTIGLYGAVPPPYYASNNDSTPTMVTFSDAYPNATVDVDAYFTILPVAGCNDRGRIEGVVRVPGAWPNEGLLVLLSNFPFTPWIPPMGAPLSYFPLLTSADSLFHFTPPFGTYYLSLWTNVAPPAQPQWFGAYGVNSAAGDARPDSIPVNSATPQTGGLIVSGSAPAPHWISGDVTFNGTRPAEGLLVLFSTFPFTPEHPPQGAPSGYYPITNPNETLYAMTGLPEGTYYVSLWNNLPPPATPTFYGAFGYTSGSDTDPDPVVISSTAWGVNHINITGHP